MKNVRAKVATGVTVIALGGLTGLALSQGGAPPSKPVADKPVVHTKVIRRTIHVTKHAKPKHPPVAAPVEPAGAESAPVTTGSSGASGAGETAPVSTGSSSSGTETPAVTTGSSGTGTETAPVSTGTSGTSGTGGGGGEVEHESESGGGGDD